MAGDFALVLYPKQLNSVVVAYWVHTWRDTCVILGPNITKTCDKNSLLWSVVGRKLRQTSRKHAT